MTGIERLSRLDRENEELRDMLNQVAWRLGLGDEVHYYSGDNYLACQLRVLDAINDLIERESDAETVRSDAMDAWRWVCDHGGLSHVKDIYHDPRAVVERLGIEWSESELHVLMDTLDRRLMPEGCDWEFLKLHMSNLRGFMLDVMDRLGVDKSDSDAPEIAFDALDRRIMPEGMEWLVEAWPRFEDDSPLGCGDEVMTSDGVVKAEGLSLTICDKDGGVTSIDFGERVKRPAKVLDADGVEIRVGDTVWHVHDLDKFTVTDSNNGENLSVSCMGEDGKEYCCYPNGLTHRAPVLAADGKPLRVRETVYDKDTGDRFEVTGLSGDGFAICWDVDKCEADIEIEARRLTHQHPVADSWERLEGDVTLSVEKYRERYGIKKHDGMTWPQLVRDDLVRRCRALAERERDER